MATTIEMQGDRLTWDYDLGRWTCTNADLEEVVNNLMPPDGPPGDVPNIGMWAIAQVRSAGMRFREIEVDPTAPIVPGVDY